MDKASGVYLTLTDNSITTSGTTELKGLVPMLLTKGKIGLNVVTANNFESIVGYDLDYNPNYYGLKQMLEYVSYLTVWRVNQEAKLANAYFLTKTDKASLEGIESFDSVASLKPIIAFANGYVGDSGTTAIKVAPIQTSLSVENEGGSESTPFVVTLPETFNNTLTKVIDNINYYAGMYIYNASDNDMIGIISKADNKIYRVVDSEVLTDEAVGTYTAPTSTTSGTLTFTGSLSSESYYTLKYVPLSTNDWTIYVGIKTGTTYTATNTITISFDQDSDYYVGTIPADGLTLDYAEDYGIQVYLKQKIPSDMTILYDWFTLENGSNGLSQIKYTDIDVSVMEESKCNLIFMNGLGADYEKQGYRIVNRIAAQCDRLKMHLFCDAPAKKHYVEVYNNWASKILNSRYVTIGGRPDKYDDSSFIYPSVNYCYIFANMIKNYGNLNYPPAGYTYGTIVANDLIDCDYEIYANEMKTNRINWQRTQNEGSSMWEQRTTYSLNSDLSYIAPNFIIDELCDQLVAFERNFNFRYMTSSDLINQESGLTGILENYESDGFIYDWTLDMPTFEEAQAAGRTLTIPIAVSITKDSEVININVTLNS